MNREREREKEQRLTQLLLVFSQRNETARKRKAKRKPKDGRGGGGGKSTKPREGNRSFNHLPPSSLQLHPLLPASHANQSRGSTMSTCQDMASTEYCLLLKR